jgi:hypothetical protein
MLKSRRGLQLWKLDDDDDDDDDDVDINRDSEKIGESKDFSHRKYRLLRIETDLNIFR